MAKMGNPNWVKGMKRGSNGQGPGLQKGDRCYKRLRDLREVIGELTEELGYEADPTILMAQIAAGKDVVGETYMKRELLSGRLDESTEEGRRRMATAGNVDMATRLDAAKAVARYIRPTLAQTQINGPNEGPITVATFPAVELMDNDEIAKFVENMQIALAEKAAEQDSQQQDENQDQE